MTDTATIVNSPPPTTTVAAKPSPSLTASVNAAVGGKAPNGIEAGSVDDLKSDCFRFMLYGETDAKKTSISAAFGGPKNTLIILTRGDEQLIPLRGQGYKRVRVKDASGLLWAMQSPEKAADAAGFPEWKDNPNRVLIVDDMTAGMDMIVEENSTNDDGKEIKYAPTIYKNAKSDLKEAMASLGRKKIHFGLVALARISKNQITNEETISPDLPPSMITMLTADLEFVFYVKKNSGKLLTSTNYLNYQKPDDFGKMQSYKREIQAKYKLPMELMGRKPPIVLSEEEPNLAAFWKKIREAR